MPPLASEAIITPLSAAFALVGSPLRATLPLNADPSRSCSERDGGHLGRVVPDRHVAAVVLEPQPGRLLLAGRDVGPRRDLVGREQVGVGQRDRHADVEDVGGAVGALAGCLTALTSSWLLPFGLAELILMPYLAVKPSMIAP